MFNMLLRYHLGVVTLHFTNCRLIVDGWPVFLIICRRIPEGQAPKSEDGCQTRKNLQGYK